jgi:thiol:disulfide interchange protein DsbD
MHFVRVVSALLIGFLLQSSAPAFGQDDVFGTGAPKKVKQPGEQRIKVRSALEHAQVRRGAEVTLKVTLDITPGYHSYPTRQSDPKASAFVTTIKPVTDELVLVSGFRDPPGAKSKPEPALKIKSMSYYEGLVVFEGAVRVKPNAQPGKKELKVTVSGQVCDESGCVPFDEVNVVAFEITNEEPLAAKPDSPGTRAARAAASASAGNGSQAAKPEDMGLYAFMLQGVIWGLISLFTPCVFPMIPITVSFFLKQSESQHHRPTMMASVYCGTIIVVLTIGAVLLLGFFQALIQHWAMNMALGLLFVFFALSLFGMYEIELPSGLARYTSAREGQGGLIGTVFMALTFTIVSFACVAPFLGGFAGLSVKERAWYEVLLGALAFSVTFASPFFFLALFPNLLKVMPKSGSWLNTVKVVMGFLELAAAVKFLRAGELLLIAEAQLLTFDVALGCYVALSLATGLYLLNLYRLPHDTPSESLSVPQLLFSLTFIGMGIYFIGGLSKNEEGENRRPTGSIYAWVESFLLPDGSNLPWIGNLAKGLETAKGSQKLVYIDFTGKT